MEWMSFFFNHKLFHSLIQLYHVHYSFTQVMTSRSSRTTGTGHSVNFCLFICSCLISNHSDTKTLFNKPLPKQNGLQHWFRSRQEDCIQELKVLGWNVMTTLVVTPGALVQITSNLWISVSLSLNWTCVFYFAVLHRCRWSFERSYQKVPSLINETSWN